MWYIIIGIIVLGILAAIAGYFRNRKLQKMLERGEIAEIPEARELTAEDECCGQHETCERDSLLAAVSKRIEYYDDEELDRFQGVEADAYDEDAVNEFRDVLYTLQEMEVAGWLRSLQLRAINLPDALKDEAFLIVGERRLH
ncbi:phospholipase [Parabacteroides sp.]